MMSVDINSKTLLLGEWAINMLILIRRYWEKGVQVYRKVAIEGQKAIDVIHCFDLDSEFEKVSCLNSV